MESDVALVFVIFISIFIIGGMITYIVEQKSELHEQKIELAKEQKIIESLKKEAEIELVKAKKKTEAELFKTQKRVEAELAEATEKVDAQMVEAKKRVINIYLLLPFDQQYDRIDISPGSGECYVSTVKEAEKKDFAMPCDIRCTIEVCFSKQNRSPEEKRSCKL